MGTFVLARQTDGQFYWKLNAANGETLYVNEGYTSKKMQETASSHAKETLRMPRLMTKQSTKRGNSLN